MKYKLSDICEYVKGKTSVSDLTDKNYVSTENLIPNRGGLSRASSLPTTETTQIYNRGDVLISNIRPYFKKIWYANFDGGCSNDVLVLRSSPSVDSKYLYYALSEDRFFDYTMATSHGAKMPRGDKKAIMQYQVDVPEYKSQRKIAALLSVIDEKIELNSEINKNLSEQAQAIYQHMFVETENNKRIKCRTDEYFDITIGKTPPRKEKEWFSENPDDCVWISISDMGSCGTYINDSSEYLTQEAVNKHNVKIVPDNTVILSFKLTVGRIAITVGETTTNEAIAHFNSANKNITEYLYCYLKAFDFASLSSTSSIGTAVNSKTIKTMDFVVPEDDELREFCEIARPMFKQIKENQFANQKLVAMRDSLLPKLMSGELDVSDLDI